MLDPQLLRQDLEQVKQKLAARGYILDVDAFSSMEARRKSLQSETEALQAARNEASKRIGAAKAKGEDAQPILDSVADLGDQIKQSQSELNALQESIHQLYSGIPNLPHESVPEGKDEEDNIEVRKWGTPAAFDFAVKDHVDLGESLGMMDYEAAAKLSGSRFVTMQGGLSRLHRALAQFMLDLHVTEHGYT